MVSFLKRIGILIILLFGISPSEAREEIRFIVWGDSQFGNPPVFERIVHESDMLRPLFVIQVGDLIHGYTHNEETLREEWKRFKSQISPLTVKYYPVPGNHDVVTPESEKVYMETWGEDKLYYSFTHGSVHCIVLDSYHGEEHDRVASWQRDWLKKDLEEFAARFQAEETPDLEDQSIFVFIHAPLWRYGEETEGKKDWNEVHEILKQYPTRAVFGGHTHEYVWEQHDGIDYVVINSAGGADNYDRDGSLVGYIHVSVLPGGDVRHGVVRAGSVLPLDTVDSHDRRTIPRYRIRGGTLRVDEWDAGEPLDLALSLPLENSLQEPRRYHLDWQIPFGVEMQIEPMEQWVELGPGESTELAFHLKSENAPEQSKMPWLEIKTEQEVRTGVVSREWEKKYRAQQDSGSVESPSSILLDAPSTFKARFDLFVPPVVNAPEKSARITLDGKLDEEVWSESALIDSFSQGDNARPEVETRVRLFYDDNYLYVGAWLEEPRTDKLTTNSEPPIALTWSDDDFELFFDTENSQSNYLRLFQNAAGTRFNSLPRYVENKYFESAYESGLHVGENHWALEMKIPWSDLNLTQGPASGDEWGFNVGRHRQQSYHKEFQWSGPLYSPARYGVLRFE